MSDEEKNENENEEKKPVKDVDASYRAFLWKEIMAIREAERRGDYATALEYALTLVNYLPIEVKKKLRERVKTIRKEIREAAVNTSGSSYFGQSLARAKTVARMSKLFLEEFTDLLSTQLDLREVYIEKQGRIIPTGFE